MKCFVIAMESEAAPLLKHVKIEREYKIGVKRIIVGKLFEKQVGVVICGVGKVNAACGAQYAIDVLGADVIINIGVAGGLNSSLKVGETYCISHAVQYDFDLVQLNGTPMGTLNEFEERFLPLSTVNLYPLKKLGTGDRFNDDIKDYELLSKDMCADIRDMEGGAIVQACIHANVKVYSFKTISDLANSGSTTDQFLENLKVCTANMTQRIKEIWEAVNG
ncbi:MAG: 5'-methylthioadenosine/S-adenosylhomocysteine nucleosidase [Clostridia bacterium]|nr:5'-methylthioadenosine/S-adenosylhomocysteine nucleosidase [Clostridia bacterium]